MAAPFKTYSHSSSYIFLEFQPVIQLLQTGMPFWKICDISCRLTTRQSLYGSAINSRPSSSKVISAVAQV
jgi:hypothetical protein